MSELNIVGKARGEFHLIITRANGNIEETTFKNMLLNNAFTKQGPVLAFCTVGSGTTPPAGTDTQLVSRLGSNISDGAISVELSTTFVGSIATVARKTTMVFSAGGVIGNVSELAIYESSTISASNIIIRTLVTDVNGNPTTITLGAGDQLTVEHTLYVDIETRPTPVVMNINGTDHTVSIVVGWPEFYGSSTAFNAMFLPGIQTTSNSARFAETINVGSVGSKVRPSIAGVASYATTPTVTNDMSTAALGVKTATATITMATSTQLTGGVSIGGVGYGTNIGLTTAVLFAPPLPKNSTVGYTIKITATLERV
jgi:hypothetical protein